MDHVIVAANQLDKIKVQATQTQVDPIKAQVTVADAQDAQDDQAKAHATAVDILAVDQRKALTIEAVTQAVDQIKALIIVADTRVARRNALVIVADIPAAQKEVHDTSAVVQAEEALTEADALEAIEINEISKFGLETGKRIIFIKMLSLN